MEPLTLSPSLASHPRLAADVVALWRAPGVLQIGPDADTGMVLAGLPRQAERLLARLDGRHPLSHLVGDRPQEWASDLLRQLDAAGWLADGPAPEPRAHVVGLLGDSPVARRVAGHLGRAGVSAVVSDPSGADREDVVVVAHPACEPPRTLLDPLLARDTPHLVVRLVPGGAWVGPLVVPGSTSCLRCTDLTRRHRDPAWPLLLAQLSERPAPSDPLGLAWAAATAAAQVMGFLSSGSCQTWGATLEQSTPDRHLRWRPWPVHPECGCADAVVGTSPGSRHNGRHARRATPAARRVG